MRSCSTTCLYLIALGAAVLWGHCPLVFACVTARQSPQRVTKNCSCRMFDSTTGQWQVTQPRQILSAALCTKRNRESNCQQWPKWQQLRYRQSGLPPLPVHSGCWIRTNRLDLWSMVIGLVMYGGGQWFFLLLSDQYLVSVQADWWTMLNTLYLNKLPTCKMYIYHLSYHPIYGLNVRPYRNMHCTTRNGIVKHY